MKTNFVFFELLETAPLTPDQLVKRLQTDYNIYMRPYPGFVRTFRAVTHYWIKPEHVQQVVDAMRTVLSGD